MGAIVYPPLPAFYLKPASIDEMVAESVERVLSLVGLAGAKPQEWRGL
jgi:4-hydroxy-3-polyprenylbenzoate decarboxylase